MEAIIKACEDGRIEGRVVVVISDVEDAYALERARRHNVEAVYIASGNYRAILGRKAEEGYVACLKEHKVDLLALAGFMRMIKKPLFNAFRGRILNIHPSLLPSFPGLEAQKQALEYGVKVSGCTVHFVDEGMDAGPIIIQAVVPVRDDDTVESLSERILKEEHRIYPEAIKLVSEGRVGVEGRRVIIV